MIAATRTRLLFIILIASIPLYSCDEGNHRLRVATKGLFKETIAIPEDMSKIQDGHLLPYHIPEDQPVFVMYIGPEECSDCRIAHLPETEELFKWSEQTGLYEFMIVFSPRKEMLETVEASLMAKSFNFPVFLDKYSEFTEMNRIPDEPRLHCFLLDSKRKPVFAGNPLGSAKMKELFFAKLDEL